MVNVPERVSGIVTDDSIPLKGCEKTTVPSSASNSIPQNENWLPHENVCPSMWRVTGGAKNVVRLFLGTEKDSFASLGSNTVFWSSALILINGRQSNNADKIIFFMCYFCLIKVVANLGKDFY